ncbi:MAG: dihydroneopterin aldolase [Rhodospirillaceae bacterium]|nr:dihydroneopterin aldolase [Rhodospirillaceae bacterium]
MEIVSTKLCLVDFEVRADIGIHDFEQGALQRVLISVEMEVTSATLEAADQIQTVLDYDFLRQEILTLVEGQRFNLQETLCREVVAILNRQPTVLGAVVSIRKPDVYPDAGSVGVEMVFRR